MGFLFGASIVAGLIFLNPAQIVVPLLAVLPVVALVISIIQQRQMRKSLRKREEALRKQQLEFAQNVSHELRHPLTLVLGCVDLLAEGGLNGESERSLLKTLHRHTHDLVDRVEMITAFQELPRRYLKLEPVDIYGLVKKALRIVSSDAREVGVTLNLNRQTGPSVTVGDEAWLLLALRYLFDNAIKFSPDGGTVFVRLYSTGEEICVEVVDQGVGIPASQMRLIFEPFQQGDGSATRQFGGVGLGLTVAQQVADAHDGRLFAESGGDRRGSAFTLALPMVLPIRMTEPTLMFQVAHERWDGGRTTSARCA
jgi:signal transduction histidine kinase